MEPTEWPGVFREGRTLYTRNADPGRRVYGEPLRVADGVEYRAWDPFRSKLAALLLRGAQPDVLRPPAAALYLGAAHGTTVSHLADAWPSTEIFVVEKSPTAFAPLLALARRRPNLLPILGDAQLPERYRADVGEVEFLYQDIAQRDQARIFLDNASVMLAPSGSGVLMLKVRSVTQRRPAEAIVRDAVAELGRGGCRVASRPGLAPFSRDHAALVIAR